MPRFHVSVAVIVLGVAASSASAENFEFQFLSPSFGGNPLNGTYLYGVAQAQATATDQSAVGGQTASGGGTASGGSTIGGPTIIIPINTDTGNTTPVTVGGTSGSATAREARISQIGEN
ncbi:hypothetical protein IV417_10445 [Alphaproteobacteria bacterium KMM 3653]|uniref:Curli production assembly/transport component CsgF n=1 Tax=Harenicola maris TaxID=2841044 RepID=A0AAP2G8T2_9RHOB|nr:hypothetical protein [Harenicola maris]